MNIKKFELICDFVAQVYMGRKTLKSLTQFIKSSLNVDNYNENKFIKIPEFLRYQIAQHIGKICKISKRSIDQQFAEGHYTNCVEQNHIPKLYDLSAILQANLQNLCKLENWLTNFPMFPKTWGEATDDVRDFANSVLIEYEQLKGVKIPQIDSSKITEPFVWNSVFKKFIRKYWSKLPTQSQNKLLENFEIFVV